MVRGRASACPVCFGAMRAGKCTACGVAIGVAKGVGGKTAEERTIASAGAEDIGRASLPEPEATFDDGAVRDAIDNTRTRGTVLGHNYTEPPPRRGVVNSPPRKPS